MDKHDKAQWDSPQFSWLVDGVPVTNQTGSRLNISEVQGVNYTCVIKSSLGVTLTTHYEAPKGIFQCQECMARVGYRLNFNHTDSDSHQFLILVPRR